MQKRVWTIRISLFSFIIIMSLLISLILKNSFTVNYINTTFFIGLILLVISGSSFVIINGFFSAFAMGFKVIFNRNDESIDKSHWSYDKLENKDDKTESLRDKAKKELFIYLPLTVGLFLMLQCIIILII